MRIEMKIVRTCALVALFSAVCGCAGANSAVRSGEVAVQGHAGVLTDIRVSGDGGASRVAITADRPVAYTFYKTENPPKAVIDLAQIEPGAVALPLEVNKGGIKRIEAAKYGEGAAVMTRVEVYLARDAEVSAATDSRDRNILQLSVTSPEPPAAPSAAAALPVPAQPQAVVPEATRPILAEPAPMNATAAEAVTPATIEAPAAAQSKETAVTAIETGASGLEIRISGSAAEIKSFRLAKPDRLVVDVIGAKASLPAKVVPLNSFGVGTARIGAYPDKVRIVLDAAGGSLPPLTVDKSEQGVRIVPAGRSEEAAKSSMTKATTASTSAAPPVVVPEPARKEKADVAVEKRSVAKKESPAVEAIDFKVVDGISRLMIDVSADCRAETPVRTPEGVSLTLKNCILPVKWQRFLDTSAFASVVQRVTPYQVKTKGGSDVKVQVRLRHASAFELARAGNLITLDITNPAGLEAPAVAAELAAPPAQPKPAANAVEASTSKMEGSKKVYTGRRVTLEFSDADIRKIFQLIAEVSNLNFLVGDDVTGTISIKLVNVPWDQALDVILENKGLGMQRDGNIVQIRPKAKIQTLADEEQAMKRAKERAMELKTEVFDINFANVSDIANQFNALKSERGTISQDTRTNRVIVKDIEPNIVEMKALLKNLDLPEKQVLIEARIVEASSTFTRDLGAQWAFHYKDGSASILGVNQFDLGFGGIVTPPPSSGFQSSSSSGGSAGISFGKLTNAVQVDLRISAAATAGLVKIISTPKVITLNNKAAKISQGQSIPYQTTSAEGTKTEFVEAALTLEVTPHITSDGSISMKIKASNNSAGTGTPPPINKKEATTELLVKNGETTVIGGIYVDSDTENNTGVPFLMDIPLLGWMFKSNTKNKTKTELLIFITPKIVT